MIWLNVWALLGVIGIALPVAIHLLGRGHARVQKFPTLRFVEASRLMPTKRTRIHDLALLLVRAGVIAAAAAALAQPLFLTAGRRRSLDRGLARAIVIDTSTSMRPAIDSARAVARRLASDAQSSITIESNDPAAALSGAEAWLKRQGRRGEIVVLSDFQRGQIDSADVAHVPADFGFATRRFTVLPPPNPLELRAALGNGALVARTSADADRSVVEWTALPGGRIDTSAISLLAGDRDRAGIAAIETAAATRAVSLPWDSSRAVTVVFPRYSGSDELQRRLASPHSPWMADLVIRLATDSIPIAASGEQTVAGRRRLVIVTSSEPGTVAAARLVADVRQALSAAPDGRELEPSTLSDAELATWHRDAPVDDRSQLKPTDDNGPSDGRWLWLVALGLLLVEMRLRRTAAAPRAIAEERARAA